MTGLGYHETSDTELTLAVMLRDAFTGRPSLRGPVNVRVAGVEEGWSKPLESTYLFFRLPAGPHSIEVESRSEPPLYQPVSFSVSLPATDPAWRAYPDRTLADPAKSFDDATQLPLFRSQFLNTCLLPTAAYEFPAGTSLIRGTVRNALGPLDGVSVRVTGETRYVTTATGEYVVFLKSFLPSLNLEFSRGGYATQNVAVSVQAQSTTVINVVMTP
ncbi:MAG TPA: hypothetical protein VG937_10490 [Polyangiaceae bacterium]|nr:hypothetical protein [Polyangiaceae bacterium]